MTTTTTTSTTAATATATDRDALPYVYPMHTTDALARLDMPIRRAIDQVAEHGWPSIKRPPNWLRPEHFNNAMPSEAEFARTVERHTKHLWQPVAGFDEPRDLADAIGYCLRVRGVSVFAAVALADVVLADVVEIADREIADAVWLGTKRAESHAKQTLDVEVTHAPVKRAQHAGASWTIRIYMRPITPTAATPTETSYACAVLNDQGAPTPELLALLDTFGADGGSVLDLAASPPEHVLLLRDRLPGRRARAITTDDMRVTRHLLRYDGYPT